MIEEVSAVESNELSVVDPNQEVNSRGAELVFENVSVTYPNGYTAVQGANLHVKPGEIVAFLGASGSGKSTLLRAVAGLEEVSTGRILIDGENVVHVPTHQRNVGMVFQDGQLFPHRNVFRNVIYGLEMAKTPREKMQRRGEELLALVGMSEFAHRSVTTLSGGQAQRIALARTLAREPRIVLFDEPLSALDKDLRAGLGSQLRKILKETGTTALFVTHDHEEAELVADRIVTMGEILGNDS